MIFKDIVSHDIENSILKPYIIPTQRNKYAQGVDKSDYSCYNTVPQREWLGRQLNNIYLHTYFLVPLFEF